MKTNILFIFLASLSILACKKETNQTEIPQFDLAILNANIIDLETGKTIQQHVFITNDRIARITGIDSMFSYETEKVIDVEGNYMLPGFWDNHVHFRGGDSLIKDNKDFLKLYIQNGITTVRDAGGDLTTSVMQWKTQIENHELIGPTIISAGPKIDGPDAFWDGSLEVNSEEEIGRALDSLEKLKVDFVKLYASSISGDHYLESIREAEKRGFITSGHMPFSVTVEETVNAGIDGFEHMYYMMKGSSSKEKEITDLVASGKLSFWSSMTQLMGTQNDSVKLKMFDLLKKNEVFVIPTLYIGKVLSSIPETDHTNDPYLKLMSEGIIKTYEGRIIGAMNASKQQRENRKNLELVFSTLVNDLNANGVQLLAGSDCGAFNSYVYPGESLHKELQAMVEAGLTPLEALKTSAYNGSKFLSLHQDYGEIGAGKVADLVILKSNPLEQIKNTQTIAFVIKSGLVVKKP